MFALALGHLIDAVHEHQCLPAAEQAMNPSRRHLMGNVPANCQRELLGSRQVAVDIATQRDEERYCPVQPS